jgi:hypothetical protein
LPREFPTVRQSEEGGDRSNSEAARELLFDFGVHLPKPDLRLELYGR